MAIFRGAFSVKQLFLKNPQIAKVLLEAASEAILRDGLSAERALIDLLRIRIDLNLNPMRHPRLFTGEVFDWLYEQLDLSQIEAQEHWHELDRLIWAFNYAEVCNRENFPIEVVAVGAIEVVALELVVDGTIKVDELAVVKTAEVVVVELVVRAIVLVDEAELVKTVVSVDEDTLVEIDVCPALVVKPVEELPVLEMSIDVLETSPLVGKLIVKLLEASALLILEITTVELVVNELIVLVAILEADKGAAVTPLVVIKVLLAKDPEETEDKVMPVGVELVELLNVDHCY